MELMIIAALIVVLLYVCYVTYWYAFKEAFLDCKEVLSNLYTKGGIISAYKTIVKPLYYNVRDAIGHTFWLAAVLLAPIVVPALRFFIAIGDVHEKRKR